MSNSQEAIIQEPICPFCDRNEKVKFLAKGVGKPNWFSRWLCTECDITFEVYKRSNEEVEYLSTAGKYLSLEEWKKWSQVYYKGSISKEIKSLTGKIVRYQLLTNDMKYNTVFEVIKKFK